MDGIYRVTWRKTRSPHKAADIGEPGTPVDVVALAVTHLPPDCGPAVVGTADDAFLSWATQARTNVRDYERLPEASEALITWAAIS